jgi:hypothetical protein
MSTSHKEGNSEQLISDLDTIKKNLLKEQVEASQVGKWELAEKLFRLAHEVDEVSNWIAGSIGVQQKAGIQRHSGKPNPKRYPRFRIASNAMVRIGLRRDGRTEYSQTIPRANFDDIVATIRSATRSDGVFVAVALKNNIGHPDYQVYAVIGFLEAHELIDNLRRGEYKLISPDTFELDVANLWR